MGKVVNIKSRKFLRKGKNKIEKHDIEGTSMESGNEENGIGTIDENYGRPEDYAAILVAFIDPIVEWDDSLEEIKDKFSLGIDAWNAAIIKEIDKKTYSDIKNDISRQFENDPGFIELFESLVNVKESNFSRFKNIITEFEIVGHPDNNYELKITTMYIYK